MKKKIIGFVGVALFATGLYINQAQGASVQEAYNQAVEISCESAKELAFDIMNLRQIPVTEDEQIQFIKDVGIEPKAEEKAVEIVKLAHKKPLAKPNLVSSVATSFSQEIQDKCLKDMTGTVL